MMSEQDVLRVEKIADIDYDIFALLKQRYSPRTFRKDHIEPGHINQLFEAARWSASSNNLQPWRFIYAEKGTEAYESIFECLSDFNKKWTRNAPLLMITAYKEKNDDGGENFHALHDLGLCMGNMTIQAQYLGIALHHMAGLDWKKAHKIFKVPEGFHVTTAVAAGYYGGDLSLLPEDLQDQETAKRKRHKIEAFAFSEAWPNS